MTGKERVNIAMRLGEPDRVPVFCQLSIGHYFLNASADPFDIWFRAEVFAEALMELQNRYRFDGILVNLPGRDPAFEQFVEKVDNVGKEQTVRWKNGCFTTIPNDDNPHYFQADGSRYFPTFEEIDPEVLWYVEPWDITEITYPYTWGFDQTARPDSDFFPSYHSDPIKAVKERVGEEVSVHSEVFSPFSQFLELLNYENALMALLDDPGKVHACLDRLASGAVDLARRQAQAGADAVLISSAFAGSGLISREHYSEFVAPYEKRIVDETKERYDITVYTHTCGGIGDRLDLMLQTGTQGIDTLDPPPLGTVELADAVTQLKGKAFIKGNIDPVNTLLYGNDTTVEEAVLERLRLAMRGGGYILSSACSVAPGVRPELLQRLTELAEAHGRYA
ncbi:MAG: uroporphyrinogen decarboxylase family protein [Gemmatimonadota bacterium]|nr:uroporphyrinogen decarboxylase family protein [Gemmatimonadota bacterium]